jgi:uncharacterized protein (TIGR00725 family)
VPPDARAPHIAVVGGYEASAAVDADAETVGRLLAAAGAIVITGGRQGVAAAVSRGATEAGGLTVGILPGRDRREANEWVQVAVPTGLGETRNALVVMGADAVIAFPGRYGTLSEVAFALLHDTPVIGLGAPEVEGVVPAATADEAVRLALLSVTRTP